MLEIFIKKIRSDLFKTRAHKLKTVDEDQIPSKHKTHVLFHFVWNDVNWNLFSFTFFVYSCMLVCDGSNVFHDEVAVVSSQVVKDNRHLFSYLEVWLADPLNLPVM